MIPNIGILYTCKYSIHGLWICHEILDSTKNCLSFGRRQEGLPPMTDRKQAKLRIELFEGHRPWAFRKTWNHLGKGTYALRCLLEAKLWIVLLDFVSWLWIGRSFESSQECELTHVQSSSKNTFKKKGWVIKLSVCQNFAVRNARGCGSVDQVWPPLWPLVLPWVMASGIASSMSTVHTMCPWFRSLPFSWCVSKTFAKRISPPLAVQKWMFTWKPETFAFANGAQKQLIGIRWLYRWFGCWSFHFRFISMCKSHGERSSKR